MDSLDLPQYTPYPTLPKSPRANRDMLFPMASPMASPQYTPYHTLPKSPRENRDSFFIASPQYSPQYSPYPSLPKSPRDNRDAFPTTGTSSGFHSRSSSSASDQSIPTAYINRTTRNVGLSIFVDSTPISTTPGGSASSNFGKASFTDGLTPRKRDGFTKVFCYLGREERMRRRAERETAAYEKAGVALHWTEL